MAGWLLCADDAALTQQLHTASHTRSSCNPAPPSKGRLAVASSQGRTVAGMPGRILDPVKSVPISHLGEGGVALLQVRAQLQAQLVEGPPVALRGLSIVAEVCLKALKLKLKLERCASESPHNSCWCTLGAVARVVLTCFALHLFMMRVPSTLCCTMHRFL